MQRGRLITAERAILVGGTFACFVLHLWLSSHVDAPAVVFDENGYLGTARLIAGGSAWDMPFAPAYAIGYSVVIAPAMAVFHTADAQWQAVLVVNAILLAAVFPLLVAVLERVFDVPRRRALPAATVAALVPAVVATGISGIAENLVLPFVPASLLAAWAMTDPNRRLRVRVWFGPAVVVLYAAHPRFTLAVPMGLGMLAWVAWSRRSDRVAAGANAALLVLGTAVVHLATRSVQDARWARVERLEGSAATWWDLVTSVDGLRELALTAVGQAWYLVIGSIGLVAVGIALLARGEATAPADGDDPARRRRIVVAFVLSLAAGVFATSVLFFAQNQFRADHYVYGRHNDSFTPIWVAVAVAYLLDRVGSRRPIAVLTATAALGATLSAVLVATRNPADQFSVFSPFAVAAVIRFVGDDPDGMFIRASAFGLAGIGAVTVAVWASRRPSLPRWVRDGALPVLSVGLAGWFVFAGFGVVRGTADFATLVYGDWTAAPTVTRLDVDELCIDASAVRGRATLSYPWNLPDVDVRSYDAAAGEAPACDFAVARLDDDARIAAGDRVAGLDQGGLYGLWDAAAGLALWVREGPEQDRLDARGALLPEGFPAPLPASARATTIVIDRPDEERSVAPGDRVSVPLTVTHRGAGSPWPDFSSFALAGRTRVAAQITPIDPDGVDGARSGGELPRWMLPGDEASLTAEVLAVDQLLAPLPPGRYRVQRGVVQQGEEWFASGGPDARFTLVVTPRR